MGMTLLSYLVSNAFVGSRPWYWHVFELREMLVWNYFASAIFQLKCNNYVELQCILNYLWNVCSMWLVMLNHYDLACMLVGLKSLMILLDYRSYMGLSVKFWSLQWLFLYSCSYNLNDSVITNIFTTASANYMTATMTATRFATRSYVETIVKTFITTDKSPFCVPSTSEPCQKKKTSEPAVKYITAEPHVTSDESLDGN
jgi:hypothetical protein